MGTKIILPLALAAIIIVAAGAASLNANAAFGLHGRYNVQANQSTVFGWNYQNISYNASRINANAINRTAVLKEVATVSQCRTNFIDSAAPIASKALNVTLNTSEVNSANARLQSDVASNASTITIKSDILVFDGSALRLFGEAVRAANGRNQTQLVTLRTQLNSSVQTLQNCTSSTANVGVFGPFGFFRTYAHRGWNFLRGFWLGFHFGSKAR